MAKEITYEEIARNLKNKNYAPVYFLMGEEDYYIDRISEYIMQYVLTESEKEFNQTVVYGTDTDIASVINAARRYPMMSKYQVVVVREAQNLKNLDELTYYLQKPMLSTILVFCYKHGALDRRKKLTAELEKVGVLFESRKLKDTQLPGFIASYLKRRQVEIEPKASEMMAEFVGTDLNRMAGELEKLIITLPKGQRRITPEQIEQNIGISKDFNNFELTRALSEKNMAKAMQIADHFARNPKENPLLVTISAMFTHFQRIFILNYQRWLSKKQARPMPSDQELARMLKLPTAFFLKEYTQAASLYPNHKVFAILGLLREYDLKSKGMNTGQADDGELLQELLLKIMLL